MRELRENYPLLFLSSILLCREKGNKISSKEKKGGNVIVCHAVEKEKGRAELLGYKYNYLEFVT